VDDNRHEMAELWRYAHDPDLLEASVARWAYDRIIGLEHALTAVTGWPLPTDPDPLGDQHAATQAPMRGRWRTGRSVVPRVTLYRDDQIAGLALTAELAAEIAELCNRASGQ
jgi:hypothetical protein